MLGASVLAALLLSTRAFATDSLEATLANNERAAENAIAYSPIYSRHVSSDSTDATLAYNERAAQYAITNGPSDGEFANFRIGSVSNATSEATLMHNELSAQHAIVDAQVPRLFSGARRSSAALGPSTSSPSAAPR